MHSVRVYDITHTFNGPLSGTTRVSRYQKGKTNLDFTEARDNVWQWHQLGHMQSAPCSRQITVPAPHHSVFYNQQCQSTTSLHEYARTPRSDIYDVILFIYIT